MIEHLNGQHESVFFPENTIFKIYDNVQLEDYPDHWHDPIEIIMPIHNDFRIQYNDTALTLREGDILLIGPGVLHHLFPGEGERYIIQAQITPLLNHLGFDFQLSDITPALAITPELFPKAYRSIRAILDRIVKEYEKEGLMYDAYIYALLIELFVLIRRSMPANAPRRKTDDMRQKKYVETFMSVCSFIDDHCTENLTLDEAAEYSGFSKFHFSRLFRQFTGSTFYKYLNQKRISRAEQALTDPSLSITEVALASGFSSMSAFIRMFKILKGCTPSEYRKAHIQ